MRMIQRVQGGFTLIEFMIAATISLVILAALSGAFVSSSRARDELERSNLQIENGRYAIQVLTDDLEIAGFWGQYDIFNQGYPAVPGVKPDPCATSLTALRDAMPLHIMAYNGGITLSCLSDVKTSTDILIVRHAANCVMGAANCAQVAGAPYFQASMCSSGAELQSTSGPVDAFRLDSDITHLDRHKRDCATPADIRQYVVHIYYIANNDQAGDGIPTLKRAELGMGANGLAFYPVAIAEGVEDMNFEYGIDVDGISAIYTPPASPPYTTPNKASFGTPDYFTANPDAFGYAPPGGVAGGDCPATASHCMLNWANTMAVKISLLVRNPTASKNYTDSKVYVLGLRSDGTTPYSVGPVGDSYKRHAYFTTVRLVNPAGRRET